MSGEGWNGEQRLEYKMKTGHEYAQKPAWKGYDGSLMAKMKHNQYREHLGY